MDPDLGFRLECLDAPPARKGLIYSNLKLSVVVLVPADVRQAKDSRQNEGVDVAAETKAFF